MGSRPRPVSWRVLGYREATCPTAGDRDDSNDWPGSCCDRDAARAACEGDCDRTFEIEYWAQTHLEASRWLLENAAPGSEVVTPLFGHVTGHYLTGTSLAAREGSVADWAATDRARYLVVLSRRAWWTPEIENLARNQAPVFEIRRSGGQLLAIYANSASNAD